MEPTRQYAAEIYDDPKFPATTIREFTAKKLGIPPEKVVETLFQALPPDKQNEASKGFLEKAMELTVHAGAGVMMMVKTKGEDHEEQLHLICGNSQRATRKGVLQASGDCHMGESMKNAGPREFKEEMGNPQKNGILVGILESKNSQYSTLVDNQIGNTADEIANQIVDKKAQTRDLYVLHSTLYINETPVESANLKGELEALTEKLIRSAPYYQGASVLKFSEPKDLSDPVNKATALGIINGFKANCSDCITDNLSSGFQKSFDATTPNKEIEDALQDIVDLAENNRVSAIDETTLVKMSEQFHTDPNEFKKAYFAASFRNFESHRGNKKLNEFLSSMKNPFSLRPGETPHAATVRIVAGLDDTLKENLRKSSLKIDTVRALKEGEKLGENYKMVAKDDRTGAIFVSQGMGHFIAVTAEEANKRGMAFEKDIAVKLTSESAAKPVSRSR